MVKNTIKSLTEYYKNASRVKCLINGAVYKVPDNFTITRDGDAFRLNTARSWVRIAYSTGEPAKIISYKTPQDPIYEVY